MSLTIRTLNLLRTCGERFLMPKTCNVEMTASLKVKSWLKLRCKNCYFVKLRGRTFVLCTEFAKHKQMEPFDCQLLW